MKELDESLELLHRDARRAPASLTDAQAKLMAALDAETAEGTEPQRAPWRRRRLVIPVAAAAAAAVIAVGFQVARSPASESPVLGTSDPEVTLLSAADVLARAADLTVRTVDEPLGPNQYRYIAEHVWTTRGVRATEADMGYTYLWEQQVERWIPADPRGVWRETRKVLDTSKFLGGSAPEAKAAPPAITSTDQGEWMAPCGAFFPRAKSVKACGGPDDWDSVEFYAKLPRDPDRLYAFLVEATKYHGSTPQVMFHYGIQILSTGLMPAGLRGPWYRAMAKIPGIKVIDNQADLDGRTGIALGLTDENVQRQLIIDPATGAFIGERTVAGAKPSDPWIKPGTEIGASAIRTAVVDSLVETK
jgi:hypothetical protein